MQRSIFVRLLAVLALSLGLSAALFTGSATAQAHARDIPADSVQDARSDYTSWHTVPDATIYTAGQSGDDSSAESRPCGFSAPNSTAYYNHCGTERVQADVRLWWGAGTRTVCVRPGVTNLSTHPALRGGLITNAHYNGRGC